MRPVLSPAEALGLSGATLEGRIRRAAHHVADATLARVADRLTAGPFAEALRDSMTSTVRETVRTVVSETSERLVREEIDRIKNKNI